MSSSNKNLNKAKKEKNDEFYTRYEDIEKELGFYKSQLFGKTIYCPCDDYWWSNFPKFFKDKFKDLGLKKVIATNFDIGDGAWKWEYDGQNEVVEELSGDGDFRSPECIEFLKQADVVVTNPPFSLFREYIAQLMTFGKKFIIMGNGNNVNYLLPLIKDNKMWLGCTLFTGKMPFFRVPDDYPLENERYEKREDGKIYKQVNSIAWFTNVDHKKRHDKLDLCKKYNATDYPTFDNYNAINVDNTSDIPEDYMGVMGVPITFLGKYCPDQFEIVGITYSKDRNPDIEKIRTDPKRRHNPVLGGKEKYPRILIKRKS